LKDARGRGRRPRTAGCRLAARARHRARRQRPRERGSENDDTSIALGRHRGRASSHSPIRTSLRCSPRSRSRALTRRRSSMRSRRSRRRTPTRPPSLSLTVAAAGHAREASSARRASDRLLASRPARERDRRSPCRAFPRRAGPAAAGVALEVAVANAVRWDEVSDATLLVAPRGRRRERLGAAPHRRRASSQSAPATTANAKRAWREALDSGAGHDSPRARRRQYRSDVDLAGEAPAHRGGDARRAAERSARLEALARPEAAAASGDTAHARHNDEQQRSSRADPSRRTCARHRSGPRRAPRTSQG